MSRWGRPTKNVRRRDPRYFLDEEIDEQGQVIEEQQVADPYADTRQARFPGMAQRRANRQWNRMAPADQAAVLNQRLEADTARRVEDEQWAATQQARANRSYLANQVGSNRVDEFEGMGISADLYRQHAESSGGSTQMVQTPIGPKMLPYTMAAEFQPGGSLSTKTPDNYMVSIDAQGTKMPLSQYAQVFGHSLNDPTNVHGQNLNSILSELPEGFIDMSQYSMTAQPGTRGYDDGSPSSLATIEFQSTSDGGIMAVDRATGEFIAPGDQRLIDAVGEQGASEYGYAAPADWAPGTNVAADQYDPQGTESRPEYLARLRTANPQPDAPGVWTISQNENPNSPNYGNVSWTNQEPAIENQAAIDAAARAKEAEAYKTQTAANARAYLSNQLRRDWERLHYPSGADRYAADERDLDIIYPQRTWGDVAAAGFDAAAEEAAEGALVNAQGRALGSLGKRVPGGADAGLASDIGGWMNPRMQGPHVDDLLDAGVQIGSGPMQTAGNWMQRSGFGQDILGSGQTMALKAATETEGEMNPSLTGWATGYQRNLTTPAQSAVTKRTEFASDLAGSAGRELGSKYFGPVGEKALGSTFAGAAAMTYPWLEKTGRGLMNTDIETDSNKQLRLSAANSQEADQSFSDWTSKWTDKDWNDYAEIQHTAGDYGEVRDYLTSRPDYQAGLTSSSPERLNESRNYKENSTMLTESEIKRMSMLAGLGRQGRTVKINESFLLSLALTSVGIWAVRTLTDKVTPDPPGGHKGRKHDDEREARMHMQMVQKQQEKLRQAAEKRASRGDHDLKTLLANLEKYIERGAESITPEQVEQILARFAGDSGLESLMRELASADSSEFNRILSQMQDHIKSRL